MSHGKVVIRIDVDVIWASSLFKTASCTGYYGQATLYGLDYGQSETLVARWVNKRFCLLVNGV